VIEPERAFVAREQGLQRGPEAGGRGPVDRGRAEAAAGGFDVEPQRAPGRGAGDGQQQVLAVDAARAVAGGLFTRADKGGAGLGRQDG
jgi:hypothetical protein